MTTLTAPAPPAPPATRRPVPWTKLARVTWRQHRAALAGTAALLGGLALFMLITGLRMRSALTGLGLNACHPVTAARCAAQLQLFNNSYGSMSGYVPGLLQVIPVLIGSFLGGPLLARELESGTFRFAWTQGCGRLRWLLAKLLLLAVALIAAAGAFGVLFSWWYRPFFAEGNSPMSPQLFDLRGVAVTAWTVAAFAIGAFAGVVFRRTVPAIAAALAASTGLAVAAALYLRAHYEPVITTKFSHARPGWVVSQWWTGPGGHVLSTTQFGTVIERLGGKSPHALKWLTQHHYTFWASYQPDSRYWHFQLIEGGCLLALTLLLGAATIWLVRRRAS